MDGAPRRFRVDSFPGFWHSVPGSTSGMTPGDYADLRPEPVQECVWRGQEYREHETWGDDPVCVRCGRITEIEES